MNGGGLNERGPYMLIGNGTFGGSVSLGEGFDISDA